MGLGGYNYDLTSIRLQLDRDVMTVDKPVCSLLH